MAKPHRMMMRSVSDADLMRPREAIEAMLWKLEADLPELLMNRNESFHEFECRAMFILSEASAADEAHVEASLERMIVQSGFNG